jgi:hypothetical protein
MVLLGPIIVSLSSASESKDPTLNAAVTTRLEAFEVSFPFFSLAMLPTTLWLMLISNPVALPSS